MSHARRVAMAEVVAELQALVTTKPTTRGRNTFAEQLAEKARLGNLPPPAQPALTPATLAVHARVLLLEKTGSDFEGCRVLVKPDDTEEVAFVAVIPESERGPGPGNSPGNNPTVRGR